MKILISCLAMRLTFPIKRYYTYEHCNIFKPASGIPQFSILFYSTLLSSLIQKQIIIIGKDTTTKSCFYKDFILTIILSITLR